MRVLIVGGMTKLREELLRGKNIHVKYVTCGRPGCRCQLGQKHGPYYYHRRRTETGRYKDVYVKSAEVNLGFDNQAVGASDLLVSVRNLDEIPRLFKGCPAFVVERMISSGGSCEIARTS